MTLEEAIGDLKAKIDFPLTRAYVSFTKDDAREILVLLKELEKRREKTSKKESLKDIVIAANRLVEDDFLTDFTCQLGKDYTGTLNIDGMVFLVYAGDLVGHVVHDRDGKASVKHKITLIEM